MKSQGLPMSTIVLVIIAIVVLVGVLLWFFSGQRGTQDSTRTFFDIIRGHSAKACEEAADFGGCPAATPYCCDGVCQADPCS